MTDDAVVRRTPAGWRVGTERRPDEDRFAPDLVSAMVLADLLRDDLPDTPRPPRASEGDGEIDRLRATVYQLEHALATRVVIEQAIGVIAERRRVAPQQAFERLRTAARSRGERVRDLAERVVTSATNPLFTAQLPDELTRTFEKSGRQERTS